MSWEQRNEYFCKAQTDMQMIYIETEREAKQLKAENAKLREKVQRQADELTALRKAIEQRNSELRPWKRQVERFVAENAKLRELMSVMAYCNQFRRDCDGCSMNGADGIITERAGCDELLARLRELGIEVPE